MKTIEQKAEYTGLSVGTYGAVLTIIGVDKHAANTGLDNRLKKIYDEQFRDRDSFKIGEVVNALGTDLCE